MSHFTLWKWQGGYCFLIEEIKKGFYILYKSYANIFIWIHLFHWNPINKWSAILLTGWKMSQQHNRLTGIKTLSFVFMKTRYCKDRSFLGRETGIWLGTWLALVEDLTRVDFSWLAQEKMTYTYLSLGPNDLSHTSVCKMVQWPVHRRLHADWVSSGDLESESYIFTYKEFSVVSGKKKNYTKNNWKIKKK